ncbi:MAG: Ig-like domain-containing protein [Bacteroidales bacterium]
MRFRIFLVFLAAMVLGRECAQQGAPSGGPRDEDPPRVVSSEPANYSTHFDDDRIEITFDEYIVLDNVNQELVVSPPMEEKPEVRLRKKTLIVELTDTLKENTTYTFNFGTAIKDLHEGNQLLNFEYAFSTGAVLDSLSVKGTLRFAEDLAVPEEPVNIMLYEELKDSVPLTRIPLYVGRSDEEGRFSVNNLRPDVYKVFALQDGNYNLLYDLPTEVIGFLDSSLRVNAEMARALLEESGALDSLYQDSVYRDQDTLAVPVDTAGMGTDTTGMAADSLARMKPDLNSIYIDLLLFTEESEVQYMTDYQRTDRRRMEVMFARPVTDSFRYRSLHQEDANQTWLMEHFSANRDTLTLWIRDSADYKKDTLTLEFIYTVQDTAGLDVTTRDTLNFTYREQQSRGRKDQPVSEEKLEISTLRNNAQLHLNRDVPLNLNFPLTGIVDSLISLYQIPDSVEVPRSFRVVTDTASLTRAWISADWQSDSRYRLLILPGAISNLYGLEHDTVDVSFTTRDIEYYGQILLNLDSVDHRVIVQLISRDRVYRSRSTESDGQITFPYLVPQEYTIKFIHDLNENGEWDTGDYLEQRQPEPVEFLEAPITVRSNWDHEVTKQLEK